MAGSTTQGSFRSDPHSYERLRTYGPGTRRRVGMRGAAMVRIPNQNIQSVRPCRPASLLIGATDSTSWSRPVARCLIVHGDSAARSRPPWTFAVSPAADRVGQKFRTRCARHHVRMVKFLIRTGRRLTSYADHSAAGRADGPKAGMPFAPSLILPAPDAAAGDAAAMAVRAAATKGGSGCGGI